MANRQAEKILVIKLGALGDFIQALGPMQAIRRHHPEAEITLLTTKPFAGLGQDCGCFNNVRIDKRPGRADLKGWLDLRRFLNEGGFTRVYDLQNNDRTALYFRLFRRFVKPEWVGAAAGASHRNVGPERTAGHAFDGHVQTLALAGIQDVAQDDLGWVKGNTAHFGLTSPYALVVPGSARAEKRWPVTRFAGLAKILLVKGYQPVIIGGAAEAGAAAMIRAACPEARDLTGQTSFTEIALLARGAAAAVGNDTGPLHIAAATGCPVTVLFSPYSDPARHAPRGPNVRVVSSGLMANLDEDEVVRQMLVR